MSGKALSLLPQFCTRPSIKVDASFQCCLSDRVRPSFHHPSLYLHFYSSQLNIPYQTSLETNKMPADIPMASFKFDPESTAAGPPPQLKRVWTAHIPPIRSQYKPIYGWPLAFAIFALQFANMMTFVDAMATPMLMATLSKDLNAASTIV
jgi:hypothetical protein